MRVSIGGHELPFTSMNAKPVFPSDFSGAEWTVAAEVRAGAVVLVLTAQDQSVAGDTVASVRITNPESGYTADPTVTFAAPPAGGTTATGTAVRPDRVESVRITTAGSGYAADPTVTFSGGGGSDAAATAVLQSGVASVKMTNRRSGYISAPTVTFGPAPSGGTTAAGTAVGPGGVTSVTVTNGGTGYTAAPTVTFSAPAGGTRATARQRWPRAATINTRTCIGCAKPWMANSFWSNWRSSPPAADREPRQPTTPRSRVYRADERISR